MDVRVLENSVMLSKEVTIKQYLPCKMKVKATLLPLTAKNN